MKNKILFSFLILGLFINVSNAQDDLMNLVDDNMEEVSEEVISTFKGTRLINGHTVETRDKNVLVFIISHRFGRINDGARNLWGLDFASIRLGLDYSLTDNFTIGIGRSSFNKVFDGFAKYAIVTQSQNFPVSITGFGSIAMRTDQFFQSREFYQSAHRFAYTGQLLIARKITDRLSLQLSPTIIHRNFVETAAEVNSLVSLGVGGRYKITNQLTINLEYFPTLNQSVNQLYDAVSIGVDIETGGHVFQLHLTNAQQMNERGFIGETNGDFFSGDIHFGFNITRAFQLGK